MDALRRSPRGADKPNETSSFSDQRQPRSAPWLAPVPVVGYTRSMPRVITERSFYKYLKCPSWIAHEAKEEHLVEDVLRVKLQQDGLLREKHLALLASRPMVEVVSDDLDDAAMKTLAFMEEGAQTIYRPVLQHGHWIARPDVLERVEGKSNFGDYYYVACDIKRSRRLKDEYCFQGCFYAEVLRTVQGRKPVQGYVMHGGDGAVEGYLLEEYATRYQLTLDAIERILDGEDAPHFLTSDCKQSPWFGACKTHANSCDDLSRLNRIWRSEVAALMTANITSVTALAQATKESLSTQVHGVTADRLAFLQEQAKALVDDRVIVLGQVPLPPLDHAIVIDIESDPLRELHYLIGVFDPATDTFTEFLAKEPGQERQMWESFCAYLTKRIGQLGAFPIFHYGWYEVDVFRTLRERYGMDDALVEAMPKQMVDILTPMRDHVIFPLSFYSLKDVAKYLGFHWRTSDASGMDSVGWYETWLAKGNPDDLAQIVDYNEDDVRATWHVIDWLRTHHS